MGGLGIVVPVMAFVGVSLRWTWWRLPRRGIPVLMYHKVGIAPEGSKLKKLWVSVSQLEKQMAMIQRCGYTPITFRDLYTFLDGKGSLPEKPILITFDDGYKNNVELGLPVLQRYKFPATVFVVVNTVGGDNLWHDPASEVRIPMMTWDDLHILQSAGWEIGSHTLNHRRLATLNPSDVDEELQKSRQILQLNLKTPIDSFAYPYGNGEDVEFVRAAAQKAGYRMAVGVHAGKWVLKEIQDAPYQLPRVFVRGDETLLDFSLQLSRGRSRL